MFGRSLIALSLIVGLGPSVSAGSNRIPSGAARDVLHTLQARKLLADDSELGAYNIGVTVIDRKAVLWGPAPSAEASFRAEICLRSMVELIEVRNELFVSDLVQPMTAPLRIATPPLVTPLREVPRIPRDVTPAPNQRKLPVDGRTFGFLMGQEKNDANNPVSATSQPKPKRSSDEVNVLRPDPKTAPTLGVPQVDDLDRPLTAAVKELLQRNLSLRDVQFVVKDRHVYLKITGAVHEAAREISRLPNVAGIAIVERLP